MSIACLPVLLVSSSTAAKHANRRIKKNSRVMSTQNKRCPTYIFVHKDKSESLLPRLLPAGHWAKSKYLAIAQDNFQWKWKKWDSQHLDMTKSRGTQQCVTGLGHHLWQKEVEKESLICGRPEDVDIFVNF